MSILGGLFWYTHAQAQERVWWEAIYEAQNISETLQQRPYTTVHNISTYTLQQHIQMIISVPDILWDEWVLQSIKTSQELIQKNILTEMEIGENKQKILQTFLQDSEKNIEANKQYIVSLQQTMPILKIEFNTCTSDKKTSDKQYIDSINTYHLQESKDALAQSIKYDHCASEKRIQYNAQSYILSKLMLYTSTLQSKKDLLEREQDMIINHLGSIKTDILQKLESINNLLNTYTF